MISKDKFIKTYIVLYFAIVVIVSYTAMHSPYMANHYTESIILLSVIIWLTSYYLLGFKRLVIWWKDMMKAAKKRSEHRKIISDELRKKS